jgi:hypothetical protein
MNILFIFLFMWQPSYANNFNFENKKLELIQQKVDDLFYILLDARKFPAFDEELHSLVKDDKYYRSNIHNPFTDEHAGVLFTLNGKEISAPMSYYRKLALNSWPHLHNDTKKWLATNISSDSKEILRVTLLKNNNKKVKTVVGDELCRTDEGLRDACHYVDASQRHIIYFSKAIFSSSTNEELLGLYLHELGHTLQSDINHHELAYHGGHLAAFYIWYQQFLNRQQIIINSAKRTKEANINIQLNYLPDHMNSNISYDSFEGIITTPLHFLMDQSPAGGGHAFVPLILPSLLSVNGNGDFYLQTGVSFLALAEKTNTDDPLTFYTETGLISPPHLSSSRSALIFTFIPFLSSTGFTLFKEKDELYYAFALTGLSRSATIRRLSSHFFHIDINAWIAVGNIIGITTYANILYLYALPDNPFITSLGAQFIHRGVFYNILEEHSESQFYVNTDEMIQAAIGLGPASDVLLLVGGQIKDWNEKKFSLGLQYRF